MRYLFIILLFLFSIKSDAQTIRCHPFYVSQNNLFLDLYPSATVAFSLRKLRSAYTGNCIRIRRSNDNTEQDIGFLGNYLDTTSMKTFVGANNGFVVTWYDQSTNGNNATQSTQASQPQFITSGVINTQSGIAVIPFNSRFLRTSSTLFNTQPITFISAIGSHTNTSCDFFGTRILTTGGFIYAYRTGTPNPVYNFAGIGPGGFTTPITISQQTKHLSFIYRASGTSYNYLNSTNSATSSGSFNSTTSLFNVGRGGDNGGASANGNIFELIGYNSDQSSNRSGMESNVNNYYSLY